jgi:hypothetical protein
MEKAFEALLSDAGEGRLLQFGCSLSLPIADDEDDEEAWASDSQRRDIISPEVSFRSSGEWLGCCRAEDGGDGVSLASARTGPYYSARSSWQC